MEECHSWDLQNGHGYTHLCLVNRQQEVSLLEGSSFQHCFPKIPLTFGLKLGVPVICHVSRV